MNCQECGEPIPASRVGTIGSPAKYCSVNCRQRIASRLRYERDAEGLRAKARERARRAWEKNPDAIRERNRGWNAQHREANRARARRNRAENREAHLEANRLRYARNRVAILEKNRRWQVKNRDALRKYRRDWARERYQLEHYGRVLETPEEIIQYAKDPYKRARAVGYRSGLEVKIADELKAEGVEAEYEAVIIHYTKPAKRHRYTPDWVLPNGIIIETKGRFVTEDRTKHRLIREQYPTLDIRFIFSNPNVKIGKKSKTTYGMWCQRLDIPYATRSIPGAWLREPLCERRWQAIRELL
jgi:hypothetical protein